MFCDIQIKPRQDDENFGLKENNRGIIHPAEYSKTQDYL